MKNYLALLLVVFCTALSAHASNSPKAQTLKMTLNDQEQQSCLDAPLSTQNISELKKTWSPSFLQTSSLQPCQNAFFQFNVGVGFLYFSGVKGNLSGEPAVDYRPWNYTPMKGRFTYNRTPLFEPLIGYQLNSWLKLALAYQYQGGVTVQSKMQISLNPAAGATSVAGVYSQFQANLSLNALFAKLYFQLPWSLLLKSFSTTPYLAVGVGPSWQSWTRIQINRNFVTSAAAIYQAEPQFLRQKISASALWMLDFGLKIQRQMPLTDFSLVMGCKYNAWGQARAMGAMREQDSFKGALTHPVGIKALYSFAPYLGAQWNFSTPCKGVAPYKIKDRNTNTCRPYFVPARDLGKSKVGKSSFAQFNVGPTFLYFIQVKGDLFGSPSTNFGIWGDIGLKGPLNRNVASLFEWVTGYQFNSWIKLGLSYQHLSGITVQTKMLNASTLQGSSSESGYSQFQANLSLDATLAKVYFELPRAMIWKSLATTPYLALAGGPSWQTWSRMQINRVDRDTVGVTGDPQPLRQKAMANASLLIDAGFRMQSVLPENQFSFFLGCKYNQWGQTRNIGKLSQQGGMIKGLNQPIRIKVVYSFTPYLGAQWNFPTHAFSESSYRVNKREVARFKPFWAPINCLQEKTSPFIQFNVGLGLLYFNKVQGGLGGRPSSVFVVYGPVPLKEQMIYNRTPLFEYLVGYRFNSWFKFALSYQHQGGVIFQTQILDAMNPPVVAAGVEGHYSQFQANLALDSLMAKFYFELPFVMISKGVGISPYLAVGAGPGWQSWTQVQINRMYDATDFRGEPQNLRQKISANFVWMGDVGFRAQSAYPCNAFSFLAGLKYIQWGQARSMGKITQQNGIREGLTHPFRIKMPYSFAPYIGAQWNF